MKVALVVIGRLENRYAVEFVEHYKQLGFDQIFIGDNNRTNEEHFEDVLQSYIDEKFVTIINRRNHINAINIMSSGKYSVQVYFYKYMYENCLNDYDWAAFFDFDEFLILTKHKSIKDYLSDPDFIGYNQILINWKIYTDNDLVYDDGRPCLERFTTPMKINKCVEYNRPENGHVKCIIKTKIKNIDIYTPHNFFNEIVDSSTCNCEGNYVINDQHTYCQEINYTYAYIKHFTTKTIDEWSIKLKRGVGDRDIKTFSKTYNIERFFKYNKITSEKLDFLRNKGFDVKHLEKYIGKTL